MCSNVSNFLKIEFANNHLIWISEYIPLDLQPAHPNDGMNQSHQVALCLIGHSFSSFSGQLSTILCIIYTRLNVLALIFSQLIE